MDEKVAVEFSIEELNVVLNSLGAQPYTKVAPLINGISQQLAKLANTEGTVGLDETIDGSDVDGNK